MDNPNIISGGGGGGVSIQQKYPSIVAAFRGMHVSPAKHSYAGLPRKCDYWTDTETDRRTDAWTDAGQSDPYVY